jgi:hypothetical protein
MKATDFATFQEYAAARAADGLQALPSSLWRALKEGRPELVERVSDEAQMARTAQKREVARMRAQR